MEFLKKIDFDYRFIKGNIHVKSLLSVLFLNHIELIIPIASAHEEQHICEIMELNLLVRLT